jgi:hypothetical protein
VRQIYPVDDRPQEARVVHESCGRRD